MKKLERIFPFLWLKGESKQAIAEEIEAIYQSGLRAFCLESRVHPEFCKDGWFSDVEFALLEAEKRGMQVWILDDKSYPTGVANGIIAEKYPSLKAWHIYTRFVDIAGQVRNAKIPVNLREEEKERLVGAFLVERKNGKPVYSSAKNVEENIKNGDLHISFPYGSYRVYFVFVGQTYSERSNYIDVMNPTSASKLIEAVYEPHYQRFKAYFGKTFAGFFSDEPRLCNGVQNPELFKIPVTYAGLGCEGLAYPYYEGMEQDIGLRESKEWLSLWTKGDPDFRCRYMTAVTRRYSKNFNQALAKWCHEHGVCYTGHIIEDSGAHLRTACSAGHYFRSMEGADMSGVDVVLHQIKPFDLENKHFARITAYSYADPTFFFYTLAKLASSDAQLDSYKRGRALCELFGAYGWSEGTAEMLYIANHFLSRGINYFVPHAFTPTYENDDCPPHFYAGGKNPAYKGYAKLFGYMNTIAEKFDGGVSLPDVAVLYHDEAEWSGKPFQPCDTVAKVLTENQIDFDFVYTDMLENARLLSDGIEVKGRKYHSLLVPSCKFLTENTLQRLQKIASHVRFVGQAPTQSFGVCISLNRLVNDLFANGVQRKTLVPCKGLRVYRYQKNGEITTMLFNESGKKISFVLTGNKELYGYDYASNVAYHFAAGERISLEAGRAIILGAEERSKYYSSQPMRHAVREAEVYLREHANAEFVFYKKVALPFDVNTELPDFCGEVRYIVEMDGAGMCSVEYDGEFCDCENCGVKQRSIGGKAQFLLPNENNRRVVLTLANTLSYKIFDKFSAFSYKPAVCLYSVKY